ncbi:unnamed protein product [Phaeothamnion confervicola]
MYFIQPKTQMPLEEYLTSEGATGNLLCAEFGIYDSAGLDRFITEYLPTFTLVMDVEAFDEGLVMLARLMRWELVDVLYYKPSLINDGTLTRWDGRPITQEPLLEDLAPTVRREPGRKAMDRCWHGFRGKQEGRQIIKAASGVPSAAVRFASWNVESCAAPHSFVSFAPCVFLSQLGKWGVPSSCQRSIDSKAFRYLVVIR